MLAGLVGLAMLAVLAVLVALVALAGLGALVGLAGVLGRKFATSTLQNELLVIVDQQNVDFILIFAV